MRLYYQEIAAVFVYENNFACGCESLNKAIITITNIREKSGIFNMEISEVSNECSGLTELIKITQTYCVRLNMIIAISLPF